MICKNCGATISEKELLCPYCGTENFDVAKKQQDEYVNQYEKKREKIKQIPKKIVKNTTKTVVRLIPILLGGFILILLITVAFTKLTKGDLLAEQEAEIAQLEEYYAAGDYEKMYEYYKSLNKQGGSYEKYTRICDLYYDMEWNIESLKSLGIWSDSGSREHYTKMSGYYLDDCIKALATIDKMENMNFIYGEEEAALYIREQYIAALQQYMYLTRDEINAAVLAYDKEGNDYVELIEIAMQRMEEDVQ